jgi:hypothetical protein
MGSSAFEVVLIPVLWGTVYGIAIGMAMLALMRAIELLAGLTRAGRFWNRAGKSCPVRVRESDETGRGGRTFPK